MNTLSHKQQIIESAITGLKQGDPSLPAESFAPLIARVYECGYNECRRENESQELRTVIECLSLLDDCYRNSNDSVEWDNALQFLEQHIKRNWGV